MTQPVHILDLMDAAERRLLVLQVMPLVTHETVVERLGRRVTLPHSQAERLWAVVGCGTSAHGFLFALMPDSYQALQAAEALAAEIGCGVEDLSHIDDVPRPPTPPPG